jgi:hypothetical protein
MKTRKELRQEMEDLEVTMLSTAGMDWNYSKELLDDYAIRCWALRMVGDKYPIDQAQRLKVICDDNATTLMTAEVYIIYMFMLAIILEPLEGGESELSNKV